MAFDKTKPQPTTDFPTSNAEIRENFRALAEDFNLYGTGAPAASLGTEGSVYTDTSTGKVYQKTGDAWVLKLTPSSGGIRKEVFTTSGSWTCPAGVTVVRVTMISGGGGGGGGGGAGGPGSGQASRGGIEGLAGGGGGGGGGVTEFGYGAGGGGGGGAGDVEEGIFNVTPHTSYSFIIGAGGDGGAGGIDGGIAGGSETPGDNGGNGGVSSCVLFTSSTYRKNTTISTNFGGGAGGPGKNQLGGAGGGGGGCVPYGGLLAQNGNVAGLLSNSYAGKGKGYGGERGATNLPAQGGYGYGAGGGGGSGSTSNSAVGKKGGAGAPGAIIFEY